MPAGARPPPGSSETATSSGIAEQRDPGQRAQARPRRGGGGARARRLPASRRAGRRSPRAAPRGTRSRASPPRTARSPRAGRSSRPCGRAAPRGAATSRSPRRPRARRASRSPSGPARAPRPAAPAHASGRRGARGGPGRSACPRRRPRPAARSPRTCPSARTRAASSRRRSCASARGRPRSRAPATASPAPSAAPRAPRYPPRIVYVRRNGAPTSPANTRPRFTPARSGSGSESSNASRSVRSMRSSSFSDASGAPATRTILPPSASMSRLEEADAVVGRGVLHAAHDLLHSRGGSRRVRDDGRVDAAEVDERDAGVAVLGLDGARRRDLPHHCGDDRRKIAWAHVGERGSERGGLRVASQQAASIGPGVAEETARDERRRLVAEKDLVRGGQPLHHDRARRRRACDDQLAV